jgi:hypothetical protein
MGDCIDNPCTLSVYLFWKVCSILCREKKGCYAIITVFCILRCNRVLFCIFSRYLYERTKQAVLATWYVRS